MYSKKNICAAILTFFTVIWAALVDAEMVLTRCKAFSDGDTRHEWFDKLVDMALETTREEYGDYRIDVVPFMRSRRLLMSANENRYENFYFFRDYRDETLVQHNVTTVKFPALLGLLGYRVCLYPSRQKSNIIMNVREGAFKRLSYGLGSGWSDVKIMRFNGFRVREVGDYESLFRMTEANRFDLFCRGVNEVYDEYSYFKPQYDIELEQSFALNYPIPVFFHTNAQNVELIERMHKGFLTLYQNGQLQSEFLKYFRERVAFTKLWQRKIVRLENPYLKGIDSSYEQYHINLMEFSDNNY